MKRFLFAITAAALSLTACAPIANTSQTIITRPLFDQSSIGGPQYPVIVRGAENVGVAPLALAQSLRFPNRLSADSSFSLVQNDPLLVNYAHLDIAPQGDLATATLTFLHGDRRIGAGDFTLRRQDFANPTAVGNISATMIDVMLREAFEQKFDEDRGGRDCRRIRCR